MKKHLISFAKMAGKYSILIFFIILASSSFLSAKDSFGQKLDPQKIFLSLKTENQSLEQVFKDIEKQTKFRFIYNAITFDTRQPVSITVGKTSVADLLRQLSDKTSLEFKQIENYFSVRPKGHLYPSDLPQ